MRFGSIFGRTPAVLALLFLFLFITARLEAAEPAASITSETGKKLIADIQAGIPFEGMTSSIDGSAVWPGFLFLRLKNNTLEFDGHIEWTSLNHVNYIEGAITETGDFVEVDFTSTKELVKGSAASGVVYHSVATTENGKIRLLGRWSSGGSRGPFNMITTPAMTGQQSSLLGGKSINEILAGQAAQQQAKKPVIVWEDDCVDWEIAGYEYPNGDRFCKLTCNWARDRLAEGASRGEMMFIVTASDDSPLLAFTHKSPYWEKKLTTVDHIDIYFSSDLTYTLPVREGKNNRVYSTDSSTVTKIIGSIQKDHLQIDNDMIVDTGVKGNLKNNLQAHISIKGFKAVWIAHKYFMRGEPPPSMLDILNRDDY